MTWDLDSVTNLKWRNIALRASIFVVFSFAVGLMFAPLCPATTSIPDLLLQQYHIRPWNVGTMHLRIHFCLDSCREGNASKRSSCSGTCPTWLLRLKTSSCRSPRATMCHMLMLYDYHPPHSWSQPGDRIPWGCWCAVPRFFGQTALPCDHLQPISFNLMLLAMHRK